MTVTICDRKGTFIDE